jgi:hypothetical protein
MAPVPAPRALERATSFGVSPLKANRPIRGTRHEAKLS